MKPIVELDKDENRLNQIYQPIDVQFAPVNLIDGTIYQLTKLFKCRDYLSDTLTTVKTGVVLNRQYGFLYDPKATQVWDVTNKTLLIMRIPTKYIPIFEKSRSLLTKLEEYYWDIWDTTTYEIVEKEENYTSFLVTGDKKWASSTLMLSLYTFIFRILCEDIKGVTDLDDLIPKINETSEDCSETNIELCSTIVNSTVPLWAILQHHKEIHEGTNVIGMEESFTISPDITGRIHDYGGMKRFFENIERLRQNRYLVGKNLQVKTALNYFELDRSDCTTKENTMEGC